MSADELLILFQSNDKIQLVRMDVGKNYAKLFKATSLVIIYAPLYPPFYLIAVFYLLSKGWQLTIQ